MIKWLMIFVLAGCTTAGPFEHAVTPQELTRIVMDRSHLGISRARHARGLWNGKTGSGSVIWYLQGDMEARNHERLHAREGKFHE